jgi:tRNA(His) 5'-end guanylyltransferase
MREEEREFFMFLVKVLRRKNGNKNTDRVLAGRVVKIIVPSIVSLLLLLYHESSSSSNIIFKRSNIMFPHRKVVLDSFMCEFSWHAQSTWELR